MELLEALRTTGTIRDFRPEPVADEAIYRILEAARFAPSGGNRQSWHVVLVKDPAIRTGLRDLYLPTWYEYLSQRGAGLVPFAPLTDESAEAQAIASAGDVAAEARRGPGGFAEHLDEAPVILVLLSDLRALAAVDKHLDRYTFCGGASVYPFAWSLLLAAREEGLRGVMTTMVIGAEHQVRDLLAVPAEFAVAAVIALGYPRQEPRRLKRRAVGDFATVDRFDGAPLAGA
ncbi:MAG TPA: nitroreductase family protein [Acidimicrobiales bacterium]|jgi:nitroreductase